MAFQKLATNVPRKLPLSQMGKYMVNHHVSDLGWVDFDLDVPLVLTTSLPILPNIQPKQNQDSGLAKI